MVPESCLSLHTPRASQGVRQLTGTRGDGVLGVGPRFWLLVPRAGPHLGYGMTDDQGLGEAKTNEVSQHQAGSVGLNT